MQGYVVAGAAFLFAVLWFDLMFDSRVVGHPSGPLPPEVLGPTSSYYLRVTVDGGFMIYLPVTVMVLTVAVIVAELVKGTVPPWVGWTSLVLGGWASASIILLAVPRAQRIGRAQEKVDVLSRLARFLFPLHTFNAACWAVVAGLQLWSQ